jgi:hypothetical protein
LVGIHHIVTWYLQALGSCTRTNYIFGCSEVEGLQHVLRVFLTSRSHMAFTRPLGRVPIVNDVVNFVRTRREHQPAHNKPTIAQQPASQPHNIKINQPTITAPATSQHHPLGTCSTGRCIVGLHTSIAAQAAEVAQTLDTRFALVALFFERDRESGREVESERGEAVCGWVDYDDTVLA